MVVADGNSTMMFRASKVSEWTVLTRFWRLIFGMFASFLPALTLNVPSNGGRLFWLLFKTTFSVSTEFGSNSQIVSLVNIYQAKNIFNYHYRNDCNKINPFLHSLHFTIIAKNMANVFTFFPIGRREDRWAEVIFFIVVQQFFLIFMCRCCALFLGRFELYDLLNFVHIKSEFMLRKWAKQTNEKPQ